MKVGYTVKHRDDRKDYPRGKGRVVFWRKGQGSALVKWDNGECTEHPVGILLRVED